jgi:hypothetical protein
MGREFVNPIATSPTSEEGAPVHWLTDTEPKYRPEDFEDGEVVAVYGPHPAARIWLTVEIGPPESDQLIDLADQTGASPIELARELVREGLARRVAPAVQSER